MIPYPEKVQLFQVIALAKHKLAGGVAGSAIGRVEEVKDDGTAVLLLWFMFITPKTDVYSHDN